MAGNGQRSNPNSGQNMAHRVIIKPPAENEIAEALEWYEESKEGLGLELLEQINECLQRIANNPKNFQKRYREIKIVFTKRFPCGIHYTFERDTIYVHAVMHTKQEPKK